MARCRWVGGYEGRTWCEASLRAGGAHGWHRPSPTGLAVMRPSSLELLLPWGLIRCLPASLNDSLISTHAHSISHSLTHSFAPMLTHSLTHSLSHSSSLRLDCMCAAMPGDCWTAAGRGPCEELRPQRRPLQLETHWRVPCHSLFCPLSLSEVP